MTPRKSCSAPNSPQRDHASDIANSLEEFRQFRERMNAEILSEGNTVINRFFALGMVDRWSELEKLRARCRRPLE